MVSEDALSSEFTRLRATRVREEEGRVEADSQDMSESEENKIVSDLLSLMVDDVANAEVHVRQYHFCLSTCICV